MKDLQLLELFGGIGAPRHALRNIGIPVKSIDYVELNIDCVTSYNAMFRNELAYRPQTVVGWNLCPDFLVHGAPCQSFSCAGHQGPAKGPDRINRGAGGDKGSGTPSSLMWETLNIIRGMGKDWRPKVVIYENVTNLLNRHMNHNFRLYLQEMEELGYMNSFATLDARNFGLPQSRQRVFTVSVLHGKKPFDFSALRQREMLPICEFLETDVADYYTVTQPSILEAIGKKGIRRATIIENQGYCGTITTRQDRTPTNVIDLGNGKFRYLTEKECWRLMGYTDADYAAAAAAFPVEGRMNRTLYKQAGNSMPIPVMESLFEAILESDAIPQWGCA